MVGVKKENNEVMSVAGFLAAHTSIGSADENRKIPERIRRDVVAATDMVEPKRATKGQAKA